MLNVGSTSVGCRVMKVSDDKAKINVLNPVCTFVGEKIALSRKIDKN